MGEKIPILSAKKATDLEDTYTKVKSLAKAYGFTAVTALKQDVVAKAMTDKKKQADFIVEAEVKGSGKNAIILLDLVCDVKGVMRAVIGRRQLSGAEEFQQATLLAKNQRLKDVFK